MKLTSFISYVIFFMSFILGRIIQNINMSDKQPEVTDCTKQQQDKPTAEVVLQIEKNQQEQMQSFASILQTSLSQFITSLGQLLKSEQQKNDRRRPRGDRKCNKKG